MSDNEKNSDHNGEKTERNVDHSCTGDINEQITLSKVKLKMDKSELPAPPPDPWTNSWRLQNSRNQSEQTRNLDEDDDIIAYLSNFGSLPFEGQTSECPSRNSATSGMAVSNVYVEDAFEHLDRLYAFAEQMLELRSRNSKLFKRVRNLERLKVLRNANNKLENSFARDEDAAVNICEEDTGFAESLLDAMLSNCRDSPFQKRNVRSASLRPGRDKFDVDRQTLTDEVSGSAPKVSKWTRVKAAFKWERAYTNDTEITDTSMTTAAAAATMATASVTPLLSPTTKYRRSPDEIRESNSTASSPLNQKFCNSGTAFDQMFSLSSSNEGFYNCAPKSGSDHSDDQCVRKQISNRAEYPSCSEYLDDNTVTLDTVQINETGLTSEVSQGRLSSKSQTACSTNRIVEKDTDRISKRPAPVLTIAIPPQEEDVRYTSSPETNSPLLFNGNNFGGNSPQYRKTYRNLSLNKDFKRQQSFGRESMIMTSKMQKQDSKWNKVRRAFLTNSALSVPSNLINIVPRQALFQNGLEASTNCNYDDSVENIERTTPLSAQVDARQDYRALRGKLGSDFHQKLIEWERLKNLSPRVATEDARSEITSFNLPSPRESLLSKRKLQEWKRVKKIRRGSTPCDQQRISRRRLTDWQLWRFPTKSEYRGKEASTSCVGHENGEPVGDRKSQFYDDFVRKAESERRASEAGGFNASVNFAKSQQLENVAAIDESEFFTLERLLSFFNHNEKKKQWTSDAQQLDECFDGYTRSCAEGTQNVNDTNEILVRTSVGSYRFEGISREFTRKLYDWERYRGISPTSSTFRLLGPTYVPFLRQTTIEASANDSRATEMGSREPTSLKAWALNRSKSVDNIIRKPARDEFFTRRSNSLRSLQTSASKLKNTDRFNASPASIDHQRTDDVTEDIMDDSEPEAMIVDIEDVIEETASPLERVRPHQTPVYSVATSETTSIAVPLGTVTSSHEPSPVCLIEIEDTANCKHWEPKNWNQRRSFSSEDSFSIEQCEMMKTWSNERNSSSCSNTDLEHSSFTNSSNRKRATRSVKDNINDLDRELDEESVKSNSSINSIEVDSEYNVSRESKKVTDQNCPNFERENISISPDDKHTIERSVEEYVSEAQPKLASCRYNQRLPNEQQLKQQCDDLEVENNRVINNGKDAAGTTIKYDNEYEEINLASSDPHYCSLMNIQSLANYQKEIKRISPSSTTCKLDEAKHTRGNEDVFCAAEESENFKRLKETYKGTETGAKSIAKKERQEGHDIEDASTSLTLHPVDHCINECRREPTIQTTAYTVLPSSGGRCLERIVINEETLNKIVIPTAGTGCMEETKAAEQSPECTATDGSMECRRRSNEDRDTSIDREAIVKKQSSSSPTRNIFIRTKHVIFSPFRRSEEHSAGKKENNSSGNQQVPLAGNKSTSNSWSPKINRHDALLRMSLSLPWPLRPSSKDREAKEAKLEEAGKGKETPNAKRDFKRCKSVESSRKSSDNEGGVFESQAKQKARVSQGRSSLIELTEKRSEFKLNSAGRKSQRASVSVEMPNESQNQASFTASLPSMETEEETKAATSLSNSNPQFSDLLHKLTILSDVVARKDSRTNSISGDTPMESHSSRIRRAKEDFLSRCGGPLCQSVQEPPSFRNENSHHYEQILENEEKTEGEMKFNQAFNSSSNEVSSNCDAHQGVAKEQKTKQFVNESSSSTTVSRPDRVKSASAGMINVDPGAYVRLTETNRGCESLPRSISKQQHPLGSLAKIVSKFKLVQLIRNKDVQEKNMSTISKLCRQSLLIDVRSDFEKCWEGNDTKEVPEDGQHRESSEK